MADEPNKPETKGPPKPKEQTPADVAAILRRGCENTNCEFVNVKRESLLKALSTVK